MDHIKSKPVLKRKKWGKRFTKKIGDFKDCNQLCFDHRNMNIATSQWEIEQNGFLKPL
jgi:hypothetical protein